MGTVLSPALETLFYLGYWRKKKLEMLSVRVRNKNKHKFTARKVCKTVKAKIRF